MCLEESREGRQDVSRRGLHWLELRGKLIAQEGDQAALENWPASQARGADFARPATKVSERLFGSLFMGAIGGVHNHTSIGEEDRRAGGGGDRNRQTAGAAAFQHRMMTAREEAFPRKRETVGAKARKVR